MRLQLSVHLQSLKNTFLFALVYIHMSKHRHTGMKSACITKLLHSGGQLWLHSSNCLQEGTFSTKVIDVENGFSEPSSNLEQGCLHLSLR